MNLPKLPFLEKKNESEYYLSLVLRNEKISAVVFQEIDAKINVVGEHVEKFKISIEDATENELLNVIDLAVSTAEKNLPEGVESKKTIFGVKQEWTIDGKINPDFLGKLKKVSDALGFSPMGFLVIPEAVAHLMHKEEGAPVSGVLAEIGNTNITIYLLKAGKILEIKTGPVAESASKTVENLLKHIRTAEIIPSRIIIFDGGSEKLQQEFINYKWDKSLGFLHIPQITTLPANFDARAVLNGAANQMGFEVLESSLTQAVIEDQNPDHLPIKKTVPEDVIEDKTLGEVLGKETDTEEFGFTDGDIKINGKEGIASATQIASEKPLTAIDEEVHKKPHSDNLKTPDLSDQFREIPEEIKINNADTKQFPAQTMMITGGIKSFISKIKFGGVIGGAKNNPKKLLILGVPIIVLIIFVGLFLFGRSATVFIEIKGEEKEASENVTFSNSGVTDVAKNIISAEFIEVDQDGKASTATTGKKETGDKAKGVVTIFNNTDQTRTFSVGTVVKSDKNLDFVLDKAITVASASGDTFSGTEPGKGNVNVTASTFGTNFNVPTNTKFTVEGSPSSIAAKNDNAFSGGTKKDIKVVAKADHDKLLKNLQSDVEEDAKNEINKKTSAGSEVLPNFANITFKKKTFNKDIGDEASEVSLTGIITFEGISYQKSNLLQYAKEKLKEQISEGQIINEKNLEVSATEIETEDGVTTAKLSIKAEIIPKIDEKEIINEIKGKSIKDAQRMLSRTDEFKDIEIKTSFGFLPLFNRLPFSAGKIKIVTNKNG